MNARRWCLALTVVAAGLAGSGCGGGFDAAPSDSSVSLLDAWIESDTGGTPDAEAADFAYGQLDTPNGDDPGVPDAGGPEDAGYDAGDDAQPQDAPPPSDFAYGQMDTPDEDDSGMPDAGTFPDGPEDAPQADVRDEPDLDVPTGEEEPDDGEEQEPDDGGEEPDDGGEEPDDGGEETGDDGCTPGFWKNHPEAWVGTGYSPDQPVASVFANAAGFTSAAGATLGDALAFEGGRGLEGAARTLLRAAVAALLNASHPAVDYPLTSVQILGAVDTALTGDRDAMLALAERLDDQNNLGCPDAKRLD